VELKSIFFEENPTPFTSGIGTRMKSFGEKEKED
jgi:hypothetical protein